MRNKKGIAGLFDALVFLAVASVVSVALLSAFCGQNGVVDGKERERIEAAHLVLLRSAVSNAVNNSYSVEELFVLGKYEERHMSNISAFLDFLLPGLEWSWTVTMGEEGYHFGNDPKEHEQVFCSIVRSPWNGGEVVFRLEVWYA